MAPVPVVFLLPDLGAGGAQKVMLAVASGLDRDRFASRLLVIGNSAALDRDVPTGLVMERGRAKRLRDGVPWLVRRLRSLDPRVCVSVMGYLNLVLLGARPLLPAGMRLLVREANTVAATEKTLPRLIPGRLLYRSLYSRADAVICPTSVIAREIRNIVPRARRQLAVIPNPVDTDAIRTAAAIAKREDGPGLRLVAAGRLTRQKGFDRLLELMPSLPPQARLMIFGDGPDRAVLVAQAESLGISDRVTFAGFSRELPAWLAGADALVLPSRWEGLPNIVLEALALGTPVIASSEAALDELAAAGAPGAVTIRRVDRSFADAIVDLKVSEQRAAHLRPSLLPPAYSQKAVIAEWTRLLECVLGDGRGPLPGRRVRAP